MDAYILHWLSEVDLFCPSHPSPNMFIQVILLIHQKWGLEAFKKIFNICLGTLGELSV